jgi:hypothetical protein
MAYNKPLPRLTNIVDDWCTTTSTVCGTCGAPSTVVNSNLIKSSGGQPGFIAMSKHMCVGDICGWTARKRMNSIEPLYKNVFAEYCQTFSSGDWVFETPENGHACNQLKDFNLKINDNGFVTNSNDEDSVQTSKSSSHILKIVNEKYFENECTLRMSTSINQQALAALGPPREYKWSQNAIVYAYNCVGNVGNNDRGVSLGVRHYVYNCNSYSVNLNPKADRSSSSNKCCSPKISGPFTLETNYKNTILKLKEAANGLSPKDPIDEKIIDAPVYSSLFSNIPDYTLLSDNFLYNLQNRIDCECNGTNLTTC